MLELMPAWVAALTHVVYGAHARRPPAARALRPVPAGGRVMRAAVAARSAACSASPRAGARRATQRGAARRGRARSTRRYCVGCHGAAGDGTGPRRAMLITKPRDFTKGVFKFRSTPSGTLPTDEDLYRSSAAACTAPRCRSGRCSSERERWAVVAYVKGFYPEWAERGAGHADLIPPPPADARQRPRRWRAAASSTRMLECSACHGDERPRRRPVGARRSRPTPGATRRSRSTSPRDA